MVVGGAGLASSLSVEWLVGEGEGEGEGEGDSVSDVKLVDLWDDVGLASVFTPSHPHTLSCSLLGCP